MFNNRLRNQALDLTRTLGLFVTGKTGGGMKKKLFRGAGGGGKRSKKKKIVKKCKFESAQLNYLLLWIYWMNFTRY